MSTANPSSSSSSPPSAAASAPPTVLILGGILEGFAAALLTHLWSSKEKHRKASYIRIVDKFLILPQSDTYLKWIHPDARKVLKDGYGRGVEYMQANIVGLCPFHYTIHLSIMLILSIIYRPMLKLEPKYSLLQMTKHSI